MTLGTFRFVLAEDQDLEFVLTFFADVLKNGHVPASHSLNGAAPI